MKVLHLSKDDIGGGAGRAAFRLHQGLRTIGVDSRMLVMDKFSQDPDVFSLRRGPKFLLNKVGGRVENFLTKWFLNSGMQWDLSLVPAFVSKLIAAEKPDIVNLHWINRGMISVGEIGNLPCPLVWTFHDMWAATTGYHYYGETLTEELASGGEPVHEFCGDRWLGRYLLRKKREAWNRGDLEIVCPSRWLAEFSRKSPLFPRNTVHNIPYGLDLNIFRPRDKTALRRELNLPEQKRLILFGAASSSADRRKGSDLLLEALSRGISSGRLDTEKLALVVFGDQEKLEGFGEMEVCSLGYLKEETDLAKVYAAADCFVAPSREDNLPNTVLEALASGTPTIAFEIGGMPDMVEHGSTGFLASPFDVSSLLDCIVAIADAPSSVLEDLLANCRKKAEIQYELTIQASRYHDLYRRLESSKSSRKS